MQNIVQQISNTAVGLALLCLSPLLTSCAQEPKLQTVYVAVPVTSNLSLLCEPKAPLPPDKMDNGQLALYALDLQAEIAECKRQQQEYRADVDRMVKRAKTRKITQ